MADKYRRKPLRCKEYVLAVQELDFRFVTTSRFHCGEDRLGGRWSLSLRALRIWRAGGDPGVAPQRSLPSLRNYTWRTVFKAANAD